MKAVDKFEYPPRIQVLHLCDLGVRQAVGRSDRDQARTIRTPVHMIEVVNKIIRTSRKMLNEIGREPSPESLPKSSACRWRRCGKSSSLPGSRSPSRRRSADEEDGRLGDLIEDKNAIQPIDAANPVEPARDDNARAASLTPPRSAFSHALRHRYEQGPHR